MSTKAISRVVVAVCIVAGVVGLARGEMVVLAFTGEPTPDGNGTYLTFRDPVLNRFGRIAFKGFLAGTAGGYDDDRAIFRVDADGGTVICHEGWVTPDGDGWFNKLYDPAMNNASQVVFRGEAAGTPLWPYDGIGIYRESGGVLYKIFRGNDPAPDGNGRFLVMDDEALFDDDGATISWASFTGTSGGTNDDTAIVVDGGWGTSFIFAREGQTVPNGNGKFSGFRHIATNNKDQHIAFLGDMRNTSGGSTDNTAIFRAWYTEASLVELVREGDATPDGNGEYRSFSLSPALDNIGDGRIGFHAWLRNTSGGTDDDSGIFLGTEFGVVRIARETQLPPDGNGQYSNFDSDIAQNNTWVAFRAFMRNTSGGPLDEEGLYRYNGLMTTTKIIRGGEPAPDGNGVFRSFWDIVMNKPGHLAFHAELVSTSGGSSDNRGIFIGDGFDTVQAVREGDPLLGSTIVELHLATGPDCRNGLNNLAQVAYRAVLADGREALVLFTPELQWKGGTAGAWVVKTNWTLSILPDQYYEVAINPRGSADVTGPRSDETVKSLTVGSTGGGTAALNLTGGSLTVLEEIAIGADGHIVVGAGRTLSAAAMLINEGILTLDGGTVQAGALNNKGTLRGLGVITADVTNADGILRPGDSLGTLNIDGKYTQGKAATLEIELDGIGPREFDVLAVRGAVRLSGTLELFLGFTPDYGDEFEIMTYASQSGEFNKVVGENIGSGLWFDLDYGPTSLTLDVVPEPTVLPLLAIGALALIRRRRVKGD